jgi:hypothetical protein
MSTYKLLSIESDAKTTKGTALGYLTGILYLAPATEADGKHNLCPMASAECRAACLFSAGMASVFPTVKRARIAKTLLYLNDPAGFRAALIADIQKLVKEAKSRQLKPAVRINGTSDLPSLPAKSRRSSQWSSFTTTPKSPDHGSGPRPTIN